MELTVAQTLERIVSQSELPAPPPMSFDGTSANYPKFIKSFSDRVATKPFTDSWKLSQLMMCVSGEAKKAIQRFEGTDQGYANAIKTLHDRFGQSFQIVKSCIDNVVEGNRIAPADRKSLLSFADTLEATYQTLGDQGLLAEANSQSTLKRIVARLPTRGQERWVKKVLELERKSIHPTLEHLVRLGHDLAKESNHAVYTIESPHWVGNRGRDHTKDQPKAIVPKVTTLSTQVSTPRKESRTSNKWNDSANAVKGTAGEMKDCAFCSKGPHKLQSCYSFKGKGVDERRKFVRANRLCYCCFNWHMVRDCKHLKTCGKDGCDKHHHQLLHPPSTKNSQTDGKDKQASDTASDGTKQEVHCGAIVTMRPIMMVLLKVVPVCVRAHTGRSVTTFAMLDSGSSATMITNRVAQKLGVKGIAEVISVNTVLDKCQDKQVELISCTLTPVGHMEPSIPVSRAHVVEELNIDGRYRPDSYNVSEWDHLQDVDLSTEVELKAVSMLIGEDVPWAHTVMDSRYGDKPHEEPYAVKTPLAWCVAGPVKMEAKHPVNVNLVIENSPSESFPPTDKETELLEEAVSRLWEEERHGFTCDRKSCMSVEDKRAMEAMKNSTHFVDGNYEIGLLWRDENPFT
jgi:hypothetical protein